MKLSGDSEKRVAIITCVIITPWQRIGCQLRIDCVAPLMLSQLPQCERAIHSFPVIFLMLHHKTSDNWDIASKKVLFKILVPEFAFSWQQHRPSMTVNKLYALAGHPELFLPCTLESTTGNGFHIYIYMFPSCLGHCIAT